MQEMKVKILYCDFIVITYASEAFKMIESLFLKFNIE